MRKVSVIEGTMVPLDRADVDTDQIMPKQFLKRIERTGFGEFVFHDWRQDPDFVLNHRDYHEGNVLVAGPNFGCGSSREHAPWGLQQWGFEAIVAPSFADIFRSNCAKIGLLTVTLPGQVCRQLVALAERDPMVRCRIALAEQRLTAGEIVAEFPIDAHTKQLLLDGLDDIGLTMRYEDAVAAFESHRPGYLPVTSPTSN
jgi:3-isopropylmalate/(R)-2-methylmalate dehydratase small subunit